MILTPVGDVFRQANDSTEPYFLQDFRKDQPLLTD